MTKLCEPPGEVLAPRDADGKSSVQLGAAVTAVRQPPRSNRIAAAILVAAILLAYSNAFTNLFLGLDGRESIRDNPHIRQLWPLSEAFSMPMWGTTGATVDHRPILSLSFALNYKLTGLSPPGFHAVNLAIHIGAALLLLGIVRRTLRLPGFPWRQEQAAADRWAFAVALLWSVHPLQTESVTYIVQRAESLGGFFLLATLYGAVRGMTGTGGRGWHALAVAACLAGMATKESTAAAPLLVLIYDAQFVGGSLRHALTQRWPLYLGLAAGWVLLFVLIQAGPADSAELFGSERALHYFFVQPRILLHYLQLCFWPHPLYVYVNTQAFAFQSGTTTPLDIFPFIAVMTALFLASLWGLWRRHPAGFLGIWFFFILAPSSSFHALHDVIQEHRMYLPSAAVIALTLAAVAGLAQRQSGARGGLSRSTAMAALAAVAVVLAAVTHARNRDYHTELGPIFPGDIEGTLWILGNHALARGEIDEAIAHHEASLQLSDDHYAKAEGYYDLGNLTLRHDRREHAKLEYQRAVDANREFAPAYNGLGAIAAMDGDLGSARKHFEAALAGKPELPEAHNNLGVVLLRAGDVDAAREHFGAALRLRPTFEDARRHLQLAGDPQAAPPPGTAIEIDWQLPAVASEDCVWLKALAPPP